MQQAELIIDQSLTRGDERETRDGFPVVRRQVEIVAKALHYMALATRTIAIAAGTRSACASSVPARRLPTNHTIARRNWGSEVFPSTTSSVITDM